jgi:hypothetical protein
MPLGTWICPSSVLDHAISAKPMIVILGNKPDVAFLLRYHLAADHGRRARRLKKCPDWIFMDLSYLFSDWSRVWDAVREELRLRSAQAHRDRGDIPIPSILQLTRSLHRDTANIVALRETLRLHASATDKYRRYVDGWVNYLGICFPSQQESTKECRISHTTRKLLK